ncbi:MAG: hypothetical protein NUV98_00320 [Candidatus Roizmanbacteria bacterium]|nr:hypothetical protein [Candidatus Roizmanbacteria bacterium]
MKKLILLIIFFVFLILTFSSSANATLGDTECWEKYMQDEMDACGQVRIKCIFACPGKDIREHDVCLNKCGQEGNTCNKGASAGYKACAEEAQVPTSSPTTQSNSNNCWGEFDDATQTCLYAATNCNMNCPQGSNSIERHTVCLESCTSTFKICDDQASATYDACIEAEKEQSIPQPSSQPVQPESDEAACHEGCQSNYDTCASECRSTDIFNNSGNTNSDDTISCRSNCGDVYNTTFKSIHHDCFTTWSTCTIGIYNESDCQGISCSKIVEEECDKPYEACMQPAEDAQNACLKDCGAGTDQESSSDTDACFSTCDQTRSSCSQSCREAGQAAKAAQNNQPSEKPQVGVSSRDFKALVRANAEYQKAQADLEKLKADQNFSDTYNTQLDKASQLTEKPPENYLQAVREKMEWGKDALEAYQAINELQDFLDSGKFESYGRVSLITDVGNGIITFTDLVADGVSVENASTKAIIDTAAPSLFYFVPPLKAADMIATLPDGFLAVFGIPKDNLVRVGTGFLADNSPSAFVAITTDAMIKTGTWTNVGGALQVAWDDVQTAEGIGEKAKATLDLVGTAVGAIPVAMVMTIRDEISAVFSGVKDAGNLISNISSWFTYPE